MSVELSQEQKTAIAQWVSDGASLSEVQKRINSEFGASITYMDVRFLIDDLGVTPVDKVAPPSTPPAADSQTGNETSDNPEQAEADTLLDDPSATEAPPSGGVSISLDAVQRPGEVASGTVTFSDGQTGQWFLDGSGQLGFEPPYKGYRPSQTDVQQFQALLQKELSKGGY
jgi:hypothetical protein